MAPATWTRCIDLDASATIWRYTRVCRLKEMLETRTLYMPSLKLEADRHEGLPTGTDIAQIRDAVANNPALPLPLKRVVVDDQLVPFMRWQRTGMYVSCWRQDQAECQRAWDEYCPADDGIAIRSSVGRLIGALDCCSPPVLRLGQDRKDKPPCIAEVCPVRYEPREGACTGQNVVEMARLKDSSYQWEREVRALLGFHPPARYVAGKYPMPDFVRVAVDPQRLVEEVVACPHFTVEATKDLSSDLAAYGWKLQVVRSALR
jgi:hypothetical protein